jgi:hypothetical protein
MDPERQQPRMADSLEIRDLFLSDLNFLLYFLAREASSSFRPPGPSLILITAMFFKGFSCICINTTYLSFKTAAGIGTQDPWLTEISSSDNKRNQNSQQLEALSGVPDRYRY